MHRYSLQGHAQRHATVICTGRYSFQRPEVRAFFVASVSFGSRMGMY